MTRFCRIALLFVLMGGSAGRAAEITATGRAEAAPDRVAMLFYMRQEAGDDAASAEQQLGVTWKQARDWLSHSGFTDEQMFLGEPVTVQFNDQKRYVVRRVTVVQKIDPQQRDEVLQTVAKLVDQASSRGLLPASQLYQLAMYGSPFQQDTNLGAEAVNRATYFVLYLPPEKSDLGQRATRDAAKNLRAAVAQHAQAVGAARPRTVQVRATETAAASTDLKANRFGPVSPSFGNVPAGCMLTASVGLFAKESADAQTLTAGGAAQVELPIERARITVRLYAGENSVQKALDSVLDQVKKAEDKLKGEKGAAVETDGVTFFCGYVPMLNLPNGDDGQPPAGVYCDVRVTLDRREGEGAGELRQRVEKLAGALRPRPIQPDGAGDQPALSWGPKDSEPFAAQAVQKALADARANAERVAAAMGGKLGELLDVQANPDPMTYAPLVQQMEIMGMGAVQPAQLADKPHLEMQVTARYLIDMP